jgi:glycosyltransferase involved in cell wall biosynthesis
MKIAVCNSFAHLVGGVEIYLDRLMPALAEAGHELALVFETDAPADRALITPAGASVWIISDLGSERVLAKLREWAPDVVYTNSVADPHLEQRAIETAPAVHFAHDYSSTCISALKTFASPRVQVCSRPFGARCLLNYFPRRCGASSPRTMWRRYKLASERLETMQRYSRILVASDAMRREYVRNGFAPEKVEVVFLPAVVADSTNSRSLVSAAPNQPINLLFVGRMEPLKGGDVLLEALPGVAAGLRRRPVTLTMAGDGPLRLEWAARARRLCSRNSAITVNFTGWLGRPAVTELFAASDLLVVPSLWPEPFGLIGPEAGMLGLPAAAFAVGGIAQWLSDGVNGFLAPANPATAGGLCDAIVKCLCDPKRHRRLRCGARLEAARFGLERHVSNLLGILTRVATETSTVRTAEASRH